MTREVTKVVSNVARLDDGVLAIFNLEIRSEQQLQFTQYYVKNWVRPFVNHFGRTCRQKSDWYREQAEKNMSSSGRNKNNIYCYLLDFSADPNFSAPITNVTVPVGREATLTCAVHDLVPYKVIITFQQYIWKRSENKLRYLRFIITNNNVDVEWTLESKTGVYSPEKTRESLYSIYWFQC